MEAGNLSYEDRNFIAEGLILLAAQKREAFLSVRKEAPQLCTGPHPVTERDFGIPQIHALIKRIGGA